MPLPHAYTLKTSALPGYFQAMAEAAVPDRFDAAFLAGLGFRFAIDRPFVDILRELGFIADDGTPTERYSRSHAQGTMRQAVAAAIGDAYRDLFTLTDDAFSLSAADIADKLKPLYAGGKTDAMLSGIARTFLALCRFAGLCAPDPAEDGPALPDPAALSASPAADASEENPDWDLDTVLQDRALQEELLQLAEQAAATAPDFTAAPETPAQIPVPQPEPAVVSRLDAIAAALAGQSALETTSGQPGGDGHAALAAVDDIRARVEERLASLRFDASPGGVADVSDHGPGEAGSRRITIVLPESRDPGVYDAIFTSLKNNFS